jgi:hypothetical protein
MLFEMVFKANHLVFSTITARARKIAARIRRTETLIQMGDNTHHQDQLIT